MKHVPFSIHSLISRQRLLTLHLPLLVGMAWGISAEGCNYADCGAADCRHGCYPAGQILASTLVFIWAYVAIAIRQLLDAPSIGWRRW